VEAWFRKYMDAFPRIEFTVRSIGFARPFGLTSNVANVEWDVSIRIARERTSRTPA